MNEPFAIIDSVSGILDSSSFNLNVVIKNISNSNYYIVVTHRNSLETWSKAGGENFSIGDTMYYNFTDSSSKAFGENLKLINGIWCLISGDVNQDGIINAQDRALTWNFRNATGYFPEDINGDGIINAQDRAIIWNNRNRSIARP